MVGGLGNGEENVIAHNAFDGIGAFDFVLGDSVENSWRGNSIFENGELGVDLNVDGVTFNDGLLDLDDGANGAQNFAKIKLALSDGTVLSELRSAANRSYELDFYKNVSCDPSGYGEGQEYLTTIAINTNANGFASGTFSLAGLISDGDQLTVTATDSTTGSTSEFSPCVTVSGFL